MLHALPGTLLAAVTFLLVATALLGLGLGVRRIFGLRELEPGDGFLAAWLGFAVTLLFLLLWNFLLPVDDRAVAVVLLGGAGGLVACRRDLRRRLAAHPLRGNWRAWALMAVVGLWLANLATGPMRNWDTSLYHMQGVRWAVEHRAVPGLANLFGPLAFNNASFLYDALLDAGPWEGQSWHVANGSLICLGAMMALAAGARLLTRPADAGAPELAHLLTLPPVLALASSEHLLSYSPDVSLTLTRLAVIPLWLRLFAGPRRQGRVEAFDVICMVALLAAGVAIKMNAVVYAALTLLVGGILWLRRGGHAPGVARQAVAWGLTLGIAFGAAWSARGVVLSGYPAFPSPVLAAPVEWRAPAEHARAEFDYVVHSTRRTTGNRDFVAGRVRGAGAWMPHWFGGLREGPFDVLVPAVLTLLLLAALPLLSRRGRVDPGTPTRVHWLLLPASVAVLAWLAVAPAPRYMPGVIWVFPILAALAAYARLDRATQVRWNPPIFALAFVLGVTPVVVNPLLRWERTGMRGHPVLAILRDNVMIPQPGRLVSGPDGRAVVGTFQTESGLVLNVPRGRCWDAPLPCTPNPAPNLRLRVPGRIDAGFVVVGDWAMREWPEPWRRRYRQAWDESRPAPPGAAPGTAAP